ncbi:MAG: PBP1A family penicillin-binding protein [Maricaulaceae bacterium]
MQTYRADINAANDNALRRRRAVWLTIVTMICIVMAVIYVFGRQFVLQGIPQLPDKTAMWELNLEPNYTLVDKNSHVIGHRGPYIGRPLKLTDLPPYLPNAFLAIEDERFYSHPGIDRKAIVRAFFENTKSGKSSQGGSTLTQQLVKNLVLTREKTYKRKVQEMWLAYEMEQILSKQEILELYLNRTDLGIRIVGIEAASQRYFGKSAKQISLSEAALLAGIPKAPSAYDPTRNFEASWTRAQLVLERMRVNGMISTLDMSQAISNPPVIQDTSEVYLKDSLIGHVFDYAVDRAQELVGHKYPDLVIEVTIDASLQKHAKNSVETILSKNSKRKRVAEAALVSTENETGAIVALIGGRDYNASKFNRATQAQRQPGSSFKTFVYATALEAGFTPGTIRVDRPTTIDGWSPKNYTNRYRGPMTIREALKLSINTIAAQVGAEVGPSKIAELSRRFGLRTNIRATYSLALGSSEVTLKDMVGAYMVLPNGGRKRSPYLIKSIKNTSGETLYTHNTQQAERVYSETNTRHITRMLQDVVETGTGRGAQLGKRQVAGKTGTSQDYRDAWFLGFTSDYTTGVWMGNDDNSTMRRITGGLLPTDLWASYMKTAHKSRKNRPLLPVTEDIEKSASFEFYTELVDAMINERNLASGLTPSPVRSTAEAAN